MSAIGYADTAVMAAWARSTMARTPDFIIGDPAYLRRWWIIPRNEQQNVYLHEILRDDDDRALHDHPWPNTSLLLIGRYREITPDGVYLREAGDLVTREANSAHRLELIEHEPCVSLFFTGPKVREWGFHCPKGWVHWRDFTGGEHGEIVGRGCGEF
jgi:quercetin dioxygenase-like cupin family protein